MAVSKLMPSTDQLGNLIVRNLTSSELRDIKPPKFAISKMSFEHWLSWLAEKQPFEADHDYHLHFSNFLKIQALMAELLREMQREVLEAKLPQWLYIFTQLLHESESTVITLNYDSLIENAFSGLEIRDFYNEKCDRFDLTKIFPRQTGVRFDGLLGPLVARKTFDLYKLHGSIDWFWIPGDITGSSLEVVEFQSGESDLDRKASHAARGGKSEFLVPPTHSKNSYLENSKSRYQWFQSFSALQKSSRVVIAGYSMPESDTAMASMLSRALGESEAKVIILNPDAQRVRLRVEALGIGTDRIETYEGKISIQNFVEREIAILSVIALDKIKNLWKSNRHSPLAVAWDELCTGGVIGIEINALKGELTLVVDKFGSTFDLQNPHSKNVAIHPSKKIPYTYAYLVHRTKKFAGLKTIRLKIENEGFRPLVGTIPTLNGLIGDIHHPERDWLIFRPMGSRPLTTP